MPDQIAANPGKPFAQNQLIVGISSEGGRARAQEALARAGVDILDTISPPGLAGAGGPEVLRVSLAPGQSVQQAIAALEHRPGILFAEPDWIVSASVVSNDSFYTTGQLWGMLGDELSPANTYGSQANEAWDRGAAFTGSMKTVVGVIDTGIDYTHPDLYLNVWLNPGEITPLSFYSSLVDTDADGLITFRDLNARNGSNQLINGAYVSDLNTNGRIDAGDLLADARWENGIDGDGNGRIDDLIGWDFVNNDNDPMDDNAHGTHVSGTIGAIGGNGLGVVGVNWKTQIMGLKFLGADGSGFTSNATLALNYYTNKSLTPGNALYVGTNNSWGGGAYLQSLETAIIATGQAGNLFIAAAGNGGSDQIGDNNDIVINYPSNYSTTASLGWDAVVAVAAIDSSGSRAGFSNYGNVTVDLAAPGVGIISTVPGGYASFNGTSMATPHVAGAMALLKSVLPGATAQELIQKLQNGLVPQAGLEPITAWNGRLDIGDIIASLDLTAPTVSSITLSDTALKAGETATVTFTFSEAVTSFTTADVSLTGAAGTLAALSSANGGLSWTGTFTPTAGVEDATNVISVIAGNYTDLAGNPGGAGSSANFTIDTRAPSVSSITLSDSALVTGQTATVTITFNQAVINFSNADVAVNAAGTLGTLSSADGGVTWTGTFTPDDGIADATNTIAVTAGGYGDAAGNAGGAGTSANFTIDTTELTATVGLSDTALKIGDTATVTVTFSEAVAGIGTVTLDAPGTLSSWSTTDNITWTSTFTPTAGVEDAANAISISDFATAGGKPGTPASSASFAIDTLAPTITGFLPADGATNVLFAPTLQFTFSEAVQGLGGVVSLREGSAAGTVLLDLHANLANEVAISGANASFFPAAFGIHLDESTQYFVTFAGDAFTDLAGNALAPVTSYDFTTTAPKALVLTGTPNVDHLIGGSLGDRLEGMLGVDILDGRDGSDIYVFKTGGEHALAEIDDTGATGTDEVRFAATVPGLLTLFANDLGIERVVIGTGSAATANTSGSTALDVDASAVGNALAITGNAGANVLTGTDYGDTIKGLAGADTLNGGGGDDTLIGGGGTDTLNGGDGADTLDGGTGADAMAGGDGDDTYILDQAGDSVSESPGMGTDTVIAPFSFTLAADFENLTLTGAGLANGTGNASANVLRGNSAANKLFGLDGDDTLSGGNGNDTLDGGTGADTMSGNLGNDTFIVDDAGDVVIEALNSGTDTVQASLTSYVLADNVEVLVAVLAAGIDFTGTGNALGNTITGGGGNDTLNGLDGADTLNGGDGNDTLNGGGLADTLNGNRGEDTLNGDGGSDTLNGGHGNDVLNGGDGFDTLSGNLGADILTGGANNDTFRYTVASDSGLGAANRDTIADFTPGQDKIDLSAMDAIAGGADDAFVFIGTAAFTNTGAGQVRYQASGADTMILIDTDGNGAANMEILLTGTFSATANYFVL